jgi:hypothetical protein
MKILFFAVLLSCVSFAQESNLPAVLRTPATESHWRNQFIVVIREVSNTKQRLENQRNTMPSELLCQTAAVVPLVPVLPTGMSVLPYSQASQSTPGALQTCTPNPEVIRAKQNIFELELKLKEATENLAILEREASRNAVPREWRRGW